ncbi:hypothetical protein ACQF4K_20355 [Ralstonia pseudosolanacearum]|nr:hypothetical protein [Ralstonia pseudosolanacearum]MDO3606979.1 hypothetical protein [Ralstonia pseudosolanacearum]
MLRQQHVLQLALAAPPIEAKRAFALVKRVDGGAVDFGRIHVGIE